MQDIISIEKHNSKIRQSQVNKSLSIAVPKEFDFAQCLKFLGRSGQERLHFIEDGRLRKLIKVGEQPILLELCSHTNNGISVKVLNCQVNETTIGFIKRFVREWFELKRDLTPFYEMAAQDKLLKSLVERFYGLRLIKIHDLFQALCWAIFGQQINLAFAYTLYRRFIESYAEKLEYENQEYWLFPKQEVIATLTVSQLVKLQLTGKKAEYLIGVAQTLANGKLSKESLLENGDFEQAKSTLLKIRGVGPWTANYVLMRCLGDPSAFPIEDIGLHNAIKLHLNLKQKPTIEEIQKLSAGWADWQAYATFYLYRSLI